MNTPAVSPPSHGNGEPSQWVRHWAHLVAAGGAVLDVTSGAGRHARFFASRGHPVTAIDRDAVALDTMRDEPLITTFAADLEGAAWPLSDDAKFAAVVVTNYLHRPLFPQLLNLLAPGELLDVVRGRLRVVAFQDGFLAQPRPAYVQRICAILEAERSVDTAQAAPPPCYELAG
jgi:SAM-dependent methyltransferase